MQTTFFSSNVSFIFLKVLFSKLIHSKTCRN